MQGVVILGNQLFPPQYYQRFKSMKFFMAEDYELCTYYRFHKHKIIMFLSAMRHFRDQLRNDGFDIEYRSMEEAGRRSYLEKLKGFVEQHAIRELHVFEIEDRFMEQRLTGFCQSQSIDLHTHSSPMFLCSRAEFGEYLAKKSKPFMKTFYETQRRRLNILMEEGRPLGGQFSFDSDNRQKIPKDHRVPKRLLYQPDKIDQQVMALVKDWFGDHPGDAFDYWLPTTRVAALDQFRDFLTQRLKFFGPYQDAIVSRDGFLHHSLISPAVNMGLITPQEVVEEVIAHFRQHNAPIASVEGFIRQMIGWREFVRGIYQNYADRMEKSNHWQHHRRLKNCWYTGETGLPPLDDAIRRAVQTGYSHHIERLMILANVMNLCEIEPRDVHRWFMEMYVDSSDWVMAANVYGMGLMSDGGVFATKPYISGSNYIIKMSDYRKGEWCETWDGLYWRFVERHYKFFDAHPRMRMMTLSLNKMDPERRSRIFDAAASFIDNVTTSE